MNESVLRHDKISVGIVVVGIALSVLLYVETNATIFLTPLVLFIASACIRVYTSRHVPQDSVISKSEFGEVAFYSLLALAGIGVFNVVGNGVFQPQLPAELMNVTIPFVSVSLVFSFLMATSEEQFFRGEIFDLLSLKNVAVGLVVSSVIFAFPYHLNAYGTDLSKLWVVFGGGVMLGWCAFKTQRLLTPMIAHTVNNVAGTWLNPTLLLVLAVAAFMFHSYRQRRLW